MNNPIKGVVAVIGYYGTGKTMFALSNGYQPSDMVLVNDDIKEPPELDYRLSYSLRVETAGMKPIEAYQYCDSLIAEISTQQYKVVIWDTWTRFGNWCADYVMKYPTKFRDSYSPNGKIANAEKYREARNLEMSHIATLKSACDLLILTFHTKALYIANQAVAGKSTPEGSRAIAMGANLRIWLTHNPHNDAPTGLVLKNIAKTAVSSNGVEVQRVLPDRLEVCTWANILSYWNDPFGVRLSAADHETLSEYEQTLIEGTLTEDEKRLFQISATQDNEDEEFGTDTTRNAQIERIQSAIDAGDISGPPPAVLAKVREIDGLGDVTMDMVMEVMSND